MANRVGIELLSHVCRLAEVRDTTGLFGGSHAGAGDIRVHRFREVPGSPGRLTAELRAARRGRGRLSGRARVILWNLKANYVPLLLPPAAAGDLEALARREARAAAGNQVQAALTGPQCDGIVVGELREGGRREVGYVSAAPDEVRGRIQPVLDAGFDVDAVLTPALAHAAMVRQRWATSPDAVTAVVSVHADVTAITVLRGGVILFARELPWGARTDRAELGTGGFAAKLASELKRSLVFVSQKHRADAGHVLICGDAPDLRSLTAPLMHELNIEIETLDSLEGFDAAHLPAPEDEFRENVAAFRPACAVAAEGASPVSLMPRSAAAAVNVTKDTQRKLLMAAAIAAVCVGLGYAGATYLQASSRAGVQTLRQRIAVLEPEANRLGQAQELTTARSLRLSALEAFATQGPRLSLVLDAFRRAPHDLAVSTLGLSDSQAGTWLLTVDGVAKAPTMPDAQAAFSGFLKSASASKYVGPPSRPPDIKVHTEEAQRKAASAAGAAADAAAERATALERIPPPERPRDVVVLSVRDIRVYRNCLAVGIRRKFTVGAPTWVRRGTLLYREWLDRIAAYNALWDDEVPCRNGVRVDPKTYRPEAAPPEPEPFVGTILDFVLHFEVKK